MGFRPWELAQSLHCYPQRYSTIPSIPSDATQNFHVREHQGNNDKIQLHKEVFFNGLP